MRPSGGLLITATAVLIFEIIAAFSRQPIGVVTGLAIMAVFIFALARWSAWMERRDAP